MKPPQWTVPLSIATLLVLALSGVPLRIQDHAEGAADAVRAAGTPTRYPRLVVLGIDGLDPEILAETIAAHPERMRSFTLAAHNGIHPLGTSTPPQSPVAWSSFITGRDPGGHGIFDFLHRDLVGRHPVASTAVSEPTDATALFGDWQLPTGGATRSNRSGKAFWTYLAEHGVPADIWRMPANFPVEPALGVSFSGMMTPAIDSAYGESTFYATDPPLNAGARVIAVREFDGRIQTQLAGPPNPFKKDNAQATVPLTFLIDREAGAAAVDVDGKVVVLRPGEWSEFVRVRFELLPLSAHGVGGIVRFYLRSLSPELELYASPVNIDPSDPVTPISAPASASARVADRAHGGIGPYYTQGMPEDVNALKREVLSVPEFMAQAGLVHSEGERMLDHALARYLANPDGGLLFFYFSGVDLCGHMLWRLGDETHPHHDAALAAQDSSAWSGRPGSTWKESIADLYMQMDVVLGRLQARLPDDATLLVISDHGFASYARKFSLNRWLWEQGYLVLEEGLDPDEADILSGADWSRTRAYGIGFNGLYLNLAGRERDDPATPANESGIVQPGEEARALALELKQRLEALVDPEKGTRVVLRADLAGDVYASERLAEAPDLVVGYAAGYGNSDEASLGKLGAHVLEDNDRGGTFNGSHLMAPEVVAGTLLSNRAVLPGPHALEDVTVEILRRYGIERPPGMRGSPVLATPLR